MRPDLLIAQWNSFVRAPSIIAHRLIERGRSILAWVSPLLQVSNRKRISISTVLLCGLVLSNHVFPGYCYETFACYPHATLLEWLERRVECTLHLYYTLLLPRLPFYEYNRSIFTWVSPLVQVSNACSISICSTLIVKKQKLIMINHRALPSYRHVTDDNLVTWVRTAPLLIPLIPVGCYAFLPLLLSGARDPVFRPEIPVRRVQEVVVATPRPLTLVLPFSSELESSRNQERNFHPLADSRSHSRVKCQREALLSG